MNDQPEPKSELDAIDILIVFWMIFLVLFWISPAIEKITGSATTIVTELILLAGVAAYLRYRKLPIIELSRWRPVPLAAIPFMVLFSISGAFLLDGLDRLVGLIIPFPEEALLELQQKLSGETGIQKLIVVMGVGVFAPFIEETIFRGAIQKTFEKRSNVTTAVLSTALIFALIHFQIAWMIQLLVMSVFLGWLTWRWDSILPAVMLHSANNILSYWLMIETNNDLKSVYLLKGQIHPVIAIASLAVAFFSLKQMAHFRSDAD